MSAARGDDYDAANDKENAGPAYFGFVRDARGSPVPDARVVLRPKVGKTGRDQDQRGGFVSQPHLQGSASG